MAFDFPSSPTVGQQYSPVAGTTYTYNGVGWTLAQSPIATVTQIKVITASGNYVPPSGLLSAIVECVGGGGGGAGIAGGTTVANTGGGGGSGSYSRKILTAAQIGASATVNIGAAGAAGAAGNNNGGIGGDTGFSGLGGGVCLAKGGFGGVAVTPANGAGVYGGGLGGQGAQGVGDVTASGAPGESGGSVLTSGGSFFGGGGGSSVFGGGGGAGTVTAAGAFNGLAATNYGSGGGAGIVNASAANAAGGNGSPGVCIITEFIAVSAVAAPGFPVQIARVDVSSAVAQVAFTSGLDATYDEYELHIINYLHSPANEHVAMQISTDGGATWIASAGAYQWGYRAAYTNVAGIDSTNSSDTAINLGGIMQSVNTNNIPFNSVIKFRQPSNSALWKSFDSYSTGHHATSGLWFSSGVGWRVATAAFNAIKVFPRTGNITAGTFILYGIKK